MPKTIQIADLPRRLRKVLAEVTGERTPYVLTENSRPEAVLIAYEDYLRYLSLDEQSVLDRFDRLVARMAAQNAHVSEDELASDIAAARDETGR